MLGHWALKGVDFSFSGHEAVCQQDTGLRRGELRGPTCVRALGSEGGGFPLR